MELFDNKEEVIEFILTPYGKRLFRDGKFKPTYYAFGDTALLYDCRYAGFSGSQNEFVERIDTAPMLKKTAYITSDDAKLQSNFLNSSLLGTGELGQQKYPAFDIHLHSGHLTGGIEYNTASLANSRIPKFTVHMRNVYSTSSFDFSFQENLLIEVNEINGIFERENFDFSISELQEVVIAGGKHIGGFQLPDLKFLIPLPLTFTPPEQLITGISDNVDELFSDEIGINTDQVEYWFDVTVDEKISEDIIFESLRKEGIYLRPENSQTGTVC